MLASSSSRSDAGRAGPYRALRCPQPRKSGRTGIAGRLQMLLQEAVHKLDTGAHPQKSSAICNAECSRQLLELAPCLIVTVIQCEIYSS